MYRDKKAIRRGGTSNQVQVRVATKNKPITRQQSALMVCEELQIKERFVLIELTVNKKLLTVNYDGLLRSNERVNIKLGSKVIVEINDQKVASAFVFCIGSKQQCLDELDITKSQRENKQNSNIDIAVDEADDPPLVIATVTTEPSQNKTAQPINKNISKPPYDITFDITQVESNFLSSSSKLSSKFELHPVHSMQPNHDPSNALLVSSAHEVSTVPPKPLPSSKNKNATSATSSLQHGRRDPLSDLTIQLTEVAKECDEWKKKYVSLEKRYAEMENSSMMIPTDDSVCSWIFNMYDAIQRQANAEVDFDDESTKLGISSALLKYCVNRSKPPATTARKLCQYICVDEINEGVSWVNIPTNFGEKYFGRLKWNRKNVKISLQNFIRGERANSKRNQNTDDLNEQNIDHDDSVIE
ncbi:unnamed protein product [Rotaria magnacalcarata]|uniref:Uncharacterized protein n=2 Tax=Rotaria magnacalcarata TaxID=392030 RepID=A0A816VUA3_9BILA|nr:unnamed protein product [Rotaria magnacalcarata]CAF1572449.1 unnamed protein product [Rotaria magnacalcarata]CAF2124556.1 unnamed protein product [Rotaria magnacalcarata]CAF3845790.1 unnamed protein product [Rotaria magnacalcarata]CAF3908539.1 unnamed protein product [Rotaria magnacalcarata]